jgi:hypothetical protein
MLGAATFTPTDMTNYKTATATVTLTVNQASPTVSVWPAASAITYGQALSSSALTNGTASVAGTFAWTAPTTTPAAGTPSEGVFFTPTDATDYKTVTGSVNVPVNYAQPIVSTLSPPFTPEGGSAFTLTVTGQGFVANSTVYWGNTALPTTFGNATQLTAQIPSSDISTAGVIPITVQTPAPGGGRSSSLQFEVDSSTTSATFTTVTATVDPGSTATYPVTMPSSATNVSATCLNLPSGATCSYSSSTGAVTIVTSSTTPAGTYQVTVVFTETLPGASTALVFLPILLLPLAFARRRWVAAGRVWSLVFLAVVLGTAALASGCGGSSGGSSAPQTHTVTASGAITLTVQ